MIFELCIIIYFILSIIMNFDLDDDKFNTDDEYYSFDEDDNDNTQHNTKNIITNNKIINTNTTNNITNNRRKFINASVKYNIWLKYCGDKFTTKCTITWCNTEITPFTFEVGHNIPHSFGGTIELDNLRPICSKCNKSMGNRFTITEWNMKYIDNNNIVNNDVNDIDNNNIVNNGIVNNGIVNNGIVNNNIVNNDIDNNDVSIIDEIVDNLITDNSDELITNDSKNNNVTSSKNEYYDIDENDTPEELVRKLKYNAELHRIKIMNI